MASSEYRCRILGRLQSFIVAHCSCAILFTTLRDLLRCCRSLHADKIKVSNPVVELDGDEMTVSRLADRVGQLF